MPKEKEKKKKKTNLIPHGWLIRQFTSKVDFLIIFQSLYKT